jgi:hypothetical protein
MSTATAVPSLVLPPLRAGNLDPLCWAAAPGSLAQQEFAKLEAWLSSPQALPLPLHRVEVQQRVHGPEVQRLLLQAHIQQRGLGDVGPVLRVRQGTDEVLYTHRRVHHRSLKTILGLLVITRMGYSRDGSASISSSG